MNSQSAFMIKCGNTTFLDKQKNIFDLLGVVENEIKPKQITDDPYEEVDEVGTKRKRRKETKVFRGKESLFKAPSELPPRFKRHCKLPDFQKNPQRWKKYSLGDVTPEEMSNESNTAVALAFLKKRKIENKQDEDMEIDQVPLSHNTSSKLHSFRVKEENVETISAVVEKGGNSSKEFRKSVVIMPEYVVGEKKIKSKKEKIKLEKTKEIPLGHLLEFEDE